MNYYKSEIDGNTFYFTTEEQVAYDGASQVTQEEYEAYIEEQKRIAEELKNKRYFYKKGNSYLNLKSPITEEGYEEITEEEFKVLTKPPVFQVDENQKQINVLKKKLSDTDYIVLKIAEAVADSDTETVAELKVLYATELADRKLWREKINNLEKE